MGSNLPGISFACAILLSLFIPVRRVRGNVASLGMITWLVGSNLVHAINALIWTGNVDIHVPVWCDIGGWVFSYLTAMNLHAFQLRGSCWVLLLHSLEHALLCRGAWNYTRPNGPCPRVSELISGLTSLYVTSFLLSTH